MDNSDNYWDDLKNKEIYFDPNDEFFKFFGKPSSLLDLLQIYWFRKTFPLVRAESELGLVPSILDYTDNEFCCNFDFDPHFISSVCYHGFFPMSIDFFGKHVMLIKSHRRRCVLHFDRLHIPRRLKKRFRDFEISVDKDFDRCIESIVAHHEDCWLHPPLAAALRHMFRTGAYRTKLHSFEVWCGNELVAGEIGFAVGSCYSSLTGFHNKKSAGTVQLCAAGRLLEQKGFSMWDLGMEMGYKLDLGARTIPRETFLSQYKTARDNACELVVERTNTHDVVA
ncbi:MAG: hypothetical protein GY866_23025 [Proteobacteria bacterium]|nr:hypothetical protein [Pseudomonadota bacterium]